MQEPSLSRGLGRGEGVMSWRTEDNAEGVTLQPIIGGGGGLR